MLRRFHHAYLVIVGRLPLSFSTEQLEFIMALEKTQAAVANLKTAAAALIAHCQDHSAQIAQLTQAVADAETADASVAADVQSTADQINAAVDAAAPPAA